MANTDYNGWKNRSTWNIALWLSNDEGYYNATLEFAKKYPLTPNKVKAFCHRLFGDRTPDGDRMGSVDWPAIAECIKELAA